MKKSKLKIKNKITFSLFVIILLSIIAFVLLKPKNVDKNLLASQNETTQDENNNDKNEDIVKEESIEIKKQVPISCNAAIPIFMYHWIREDTGDYMYPENMVRPSSLEEQVKYIAENNFDSIFISDLDNIYEYKKPIALTFDDGWLDVYIHMFPLAQKYNVKFTMYVITGEIGNNGYCNMEQLKEMQKSGLVDIQSHTVTHPYLADLSYEKQKQELSESRRHLKEEYGIESNTICYPFGSRNENTVSLAKEIGYTYGLDMDGGVYYTNIHTNLYKIPRIYANRSMSIGTFANYANKSKVDVIWEQ